MDAAWSWQGSWMETKEAKVSTGTGNEAALKFSGVAIALVGPLTQDGGRAQVFLDGRKAGTADAYIIERTHDNVLWHTFGLKPGEHTLRIVTTDQADPRSKGYRVGLEQAVLYRAP